MNKKKTLKKQGLSLEDIEGVTFNKEISKTITKYYPEKTFKNHNKVARVLLQCLIEGDDEAYKEILDSYLRVNRSHIATKAKLSRTTVQNAFSSKGNPTLRTIAKIVHEVYQGSDVNLVKDTKS